MDKDMLKIKLSQLLRERTNSDGRVVIKNDSFGIGGCGIPTRNMEEFIFSLLDDAYVKSDRKKGVVRIKSTSVPVKATMVDDRRCVIAKGSIGLLAEALGVNKRSVGNHLKDGLPLIDHNGDRWLIKRMTDSEVKELGRVY